MNLDRIIRIRWGYFMFSIQTREIIGTTEYADNRNLKSFFSLMASFLWKPPVYWRVVINDLKYVEGKEPTVESPEPMTTYYTHTTDLPGGISAILDLSQPRAPS